LIKINSSLSNIPASTLIFNISGIINPNSTQPVTSFTISTYFTNLTTTLVATGTMGSIIPSPGLINIASTNVNASSYKVLDTFVSYSFTFNNTNPIPIGGYIVLGIPKSILILTSINSNCFYQYNLVSCSLTTTTSGNFSYITFSNIFLSTVVANSIIILDIKNVFTNPEST
jgi:hypothetical protein